MMRAKKLKIGDAVSADEIALYQPLTTRSDLVKWIDQQDERLRQLIAENRALKRAAGRLCAP